MKLSIFVCLLSLCRPAAAQSDSKKTTAPRTVSAEPKIPAGAVKAEDGTYKFTDSKGKHWTYQETPFGISRYEDKSVDPTVTPFGKSKPPANAAAMPAAVPKDAPKPEGKDLTVAYDEGDTVRFERPTPFGTSVWRKKKTELDTAEKKLVEDQAAAAQKSKQK